MASYNARNWMSRWAYHGLHSLDFPWLYNYRPLCVLGRKLRAFGVPARAEVLNEDLVAP